MQDKVWKQKVTTPRLTEQLKIQIERWKKSRYKVAKTYFMGPKYLLKFYGNAK